MYLIVYMRACAALVSLFMLVAAATAECGIKVATEYSEDTAPPGVTCSYIITGEGHCITIPENSICGAQTAECAAKIADATAAARVAVDKCKARQNLVYTILGCVVIAIGGVVLLCCAIMTVQHYCGAASSTNRIKTEFIFCRKMARSLDAEELGMVAAVQFGRIRSAARHVRPIFGYCMISSLRMSTPKDGIVGSSRVQSDTRFITK